MSADDVTDGVRLHTDCYSYKSSCESLADLDGNGLEHVSFGLIVRATPAVGNAISRI